MHRSRLSDFGTQATHTLPLRPRALAIEPDTHVAVIASSESDLLSMLNLETGALQAGFVSVARPSALAISTRFNQALVISALRDELLFVQLPNPAPVLERIEPDRVQVGSSALVLSAEGSRFVEGAKVVMGATVLTTRRLSNTRLEADVPASLLAAVGLLPVKVRNAAPSGGDSATLNLQILPPPPVLSAVSPALLEAEGLDRTITLTGLNFTNGAIVVFDGQSIASQLVSANQLTATVPGSLLVTERIAPVWVTTVSGQSNTVNVTVETARPVIDTISPTLGAPGIAVTISGRGFDTLAAGNQVRFGESGLAEVISASRTQVVARVPATARSGAVSLTTSKGVASGPVFTVIREQDFDLTLSPSATGVYQGAGTRVALVLNDQGTSPFTGLVELSVVSLPSGISANFSTPALSRNQNASIALSATAGATPGVYPILIRGKSLVSGVIQSRSVSLTLSVLAAGGVTGVKGRFVTPDGRGISSVIVRVEDGAATQSDAAGNFTLTGLPAGQVTLRMDATPAHPLYPIWPYSLTAEAGKVLVLSDWTINPPPSDDKFTPIANATQTQVITDARFPGLEIRLPAGVSIIGWDGVPKTRIAVERLLPDQLPVSAPPFPMREAYQLYFGTPMGGIPSAPIPITLPNVAELEPGEETDIWFFDGSPMGGSGEWKIAGKGTVSPDGRSVTSNPGSGIPRFCGVCGLVSLSCPTVPPPPQPPPGKGCERATQLTSQPVSKCRVPVG